jgi:epoxyqueuosine reductase QueG
LQTKPEELRSWDTKQWNEALSGSALRRIKPQMWRRNLGCL